MDDLAQTRAMELEMKKQELARLRMEKQMRDANRRTLATLAPTNGQNGRPSATENGNGIRSVASAQAMDELLQSVGIDPAPSLPPIASAPNLANGFGLSVGAEQPPHLGDSVASAPLVRPSQLEIVHTANVSVCPNKPQCYSKTTQTLEADAHDTISNASRDAFEFDEILGEGKVDDITFDDTSPTHALARILGNTHSASEPDHEHEQKQVVRATKPPDLTIEQKEQIVQSDGFRQFLAKTSRIIERAIAQEAKADIMADYFADIESESDALLTLKGRFNAENYIIQQIGRTVEFCDVQPELFAVAVIGVLPDTNIPASVINVWNMNFNTPSPDCVFRCNSKITTLCFSRFHPKLLIGGSDAGQIYVWDMRSKKSNPVSRSQLSARGHTQAIMEMKMVGTKHTNELMTCSLDGVICWWSLDNLHTPTQKLVVTFDKKKTLPITRYDVFPMDMNKFILGGEDGCLYIGERHDSKGEMNKEIQAHSSAIYSVMLNNIGSGDFAQYCLTSSIDYDIKVWNLQDPSRPVLSLENKHGYDSVMDARWSPVHPAVFASCSLNGRFHLWNLNQDLDHPVATIEESVPLHKIVWSKDGKQVAYLNAKGVVQLYDVHEGLYNVKTSEYEKLSSVLYEAFQDSAPFDFETSADSWLASKA